MVFVIIFWAILTQIIALIKESNFLMLSAIFSMLMSIWWLLLTCKGIE